MSTAATRRAALRTEQCSACRPSLQNQPALPPLAPPGRACSPGHGLLPGDGPGHSVSHYAGGRAAAPPGDFWAAIVLSIITTRFFHNNENFYFQSLSIEELQRRRCCATQQSPEEPPCRLARLSAAPPLVTSGSLVRWLAVHQPPLPARAVRCRGARPDICRCRPPPAPPSGVGQRALLGAALGGAPLLRGRRLPGADLGPQLAGRRRRRRPRRRQGSAWRGSVLRCAVLGARFGPISCTLQAPLARVQRPAAYPRSCGLPPRKSRPAAWPAPPLQAAAPAWTPSSPTTPVHRSTSCSGARRSPTGWPSALAIRPRYCGFEGRAVSTACAGQGKKVRSAGSCGWSGARGLACSRTQHASAWLPACRPAGPSHGREHQPGRGMDPAALCAPRPASAQGLPDRLIMTWDVAPPDNRSALLCCSATPVFLPPRNCSQLGSPRVPPFTTPPACAPRLEAWLTVSRHSLLPPTATASYVGAVQHCACPRHCNQPSSAQAQQAWRAHNARSSHALPASRGCFPSVFFLSPTWHAQCHLMPCCRVAPFEHAGAGRCGMACSHVCGSLALSPCASRHLLQQRADVSLRHRMQVKRGRRRSGAGSRGSAAGGACLAGSRYACGLSPHLCAAQFSGLLAPSLRPACPQQQLRAFHPVAGRSPVARHAGGRRRDGGGFRGLD